MPTFIGVTTASMKGPKFFDEIETIYKSSEKRQRQGQKGK